MRMRDVMTKDPITISSDTLVLDADRIMKERKIGRLPVVDRGELLGIITQKDVDKAAPPPTTTTRAHEMHSYISKMKVKEIMNKTPLTLSPDYPFEQVLKLGQEKKISSFLVVENGKLVGIATESDIVRFLIRVLGLKEEGSRITVEGLGKKYGEFQRVIDVLDQHGALILSMLTFHRVEKKDWMITLRVKTSNVDAIANDLRKVGFNVTYTG